MKGESTRKHLRRKLETEFGETLNIISDEKGKLIVIPDNLKACDLAKEMLELKQQLELINSQPDDIVSVLRKAALHLRSSIKTQEYTKPWPFIPSTLAEEGAIPLTL